MKTRISRRTWLGTASLALVAACKRNTDPYFGRTIPPARQRLVYVLGAEPDSLDPAYQSGGFEGFVIPALFEGLTSYHPQTLQPMAALATPIAEMLHQQWRGSLGVETNLVLREFTVWTQNVMGLEYQGVAEWGGYADSTFDGMLADTDTISDPLARVQKLADCERHLLKSMPVIPIYHNVWLYLQKPFVRGLEANALDKHPFKYAWIDTDWKPQ